MNDKEKNDIMTKCKKCETEFSKATSWQIYCSEACRLAARKKDEKAEAKTAVCKQCEKPYIQKQDWQQYCTPLCKNAWTKKARKEKREKNRIFKKCNICHNQYEVMKKWQRYCSNDCKATARRIRKYGSAAKRSYVRRPKETINVMSAYQMKLVRAYIELHPQFNHQYKITETRVWFKLGLAKGKEHILEIENNKFKVFSKSMDYAHNRMSGKEGRLLGYKHRERAAFIDEDSVREYGTFNQALLAFKRLKYTRTL